MRIKVNKGEAIFSAKANIYLKYIMMGYKAYDQVQLK